jgi:dipeptidyl aminopeptidase/acylaminoacyl peptidase
VCIDGPDIYWLEGRPDDGGRVVLVRCASDGTLSDVTPAGFNVRTRVHEYGGGSYAVAAGRAYFPNFADQRVYCSDVSRPHDPPAAMTPAGAWFYADLIVDSRRRRIVCVREDHTDPDREPVNTLVGIGLDGPPSAGAVLASGHDFYSTPRMSPDGNTLAWLAWRHPRMPWDGTELWVAGVTADGALVDAACVAGGPAESIYQPGWSPDGRLYYVSDRDGWWRLYRSDRSDRSDRSQPVVADPPAEAEFGRPQWVFGSATWAFATPSRLVVSYTQAGRWRLAEIDVARRTMRDLAPGLEPGEWLTADAERAVVVAGSATEADAVRLIDLRSGRIDTLRRASTLDLDPAMISLPEAIRFPAGEGEGEAHAFYYAPCNGACSAPPGERPPLITVGHGGPTTAARATLDLKIQFWTSRGFAVVDVNYGGSSGYGRVYRERLHGRWGIVDVADTVAAARSLVGRGLADPERLIVRGGSAGGYTTLAALTFRPGVFKAGASHYGISDIEVLARDTHKFESRYLDTLIGPYPERRDLYRARSPVHFAERLCCALILFQGLDDKVVPPNQSAMMAEAAAAKGLPVAYLAFEGEQHGFRRAETIVRSLEAELFFYGAVFGFTPADDIEPVRIANLGV